MWRFIVRYRHFLLVSLVAVVASVVIYSLLPSEPYARIKANISTREDVEKLLGPPSVIKQGYVTGSELWWYWHLEHNELIEVQIRSEDGVVISKSRMALQRPPAKSPDISTQS